MDVLQSAASSSDFFKRRRRESSRSSGSMWGTSCCGMEKRGESSRAGQVPRNPTGGRAVACSLGSESELVSFFVENELTPIIQTPCPFWIGRQAELR